MSDTEFIDWGPKGRTAYFFKTSAGHDTIIGVDYDTLRQMMLSPFPAETRIKPAAGYKALNKRHADEFHFYNTYPKEPSASP